MLSPCLRIIKKSMWIQLRQTVEIDTMKSKAWWITHHYNFEN